MAEPPTAARLPEPGIRALFTQEARWQAWLDVEAALARAEATLGMIPEAASVEIGRRSRLELFDLERVRWTAAVILAWFAFMPSRKPLPASVRPLHKYDNVCGWGQL